MDGIGEEDDGSSASSTSRAVFRDFIALPSKEARQQAVSAYVLHPASAECMSMTNFVVYLIGTLLVVAGLAYGASRLGVSQVWIVAGALVIIGLGLMGGIVKTRQKDPAS